MENYQKSDINVEFSSNIKITPWIGKNYWKSKRKIMILGESLWLSEGLSKSIETGETKLLDASIKQIEYLPQKLKKGHPYYATQAYYTKLANAYADGRTTYVKADRKEFFENICNYEYIQRPMESIKDRPLKEDWLNGQNAFIEVCKKLKPDIVICIGKTLFQSLPKENTKILETIEMEGVASEVIEYFFDGESFILISTNHVSSKGFRNQLWWAITRKVLEK